MQPSAMLLVPPRVFRLEGIQGKAVGEHVRVHKRESEIPCVALYLPPSGRLLIQPGLELL